MTLLTCFDAWGATLGPISSYCNAPMLIALAGVNKRCLGIIQAHFITTRKKYPLGSLKIKKVCSDQHWHYDLSCINLTTCLIKISCYKRWGTGIDYPNPKIVVVRPVSIRNHGLGTRLYAWVLTHRTFGSSGAYPDWFSLNNLSLMPTGTLLEAIPWC